MLIRFVGAALLLGASGAVGLGESRRLRERVRQLRGLRTRLERLKTEVCCLFTPLPEVLGLLCDRVGSVYPLQDRAFGEIWCAEVVGLGLPGPETRVLEELGLALCRGDEPERAFQAAAERLRSLLSEAETEAEKKGRLCSSLGFCAGILLVIVLI